MCTNIQNFANLIVNVTDRRTKFRKVFANDFHSIVFLVGGVCRCKRVFSRGYEKLSPRLL